MKSIVLFIIALAFGVHTNAQTTALPPSKVSFEDFLKLSTEVYEHRKNRVIHVIEWLTMSKEDNTIILDTRSKEMYDAKHIKGAIHLNFADFNTQSLTKIIPSTKTRILIYCNNNIENEPIFFPSKGTMPELPIEALKSSSTTSSANEKTVELNKETVRPISPKQKELTLALNIPTFINLYGYGYRDVYELADLVNSNSGILEFEGTAVYK